MSNPRAARQGTLDGVARKLAESDLFRAKCRQGLREATSGAAATDPLDRVRRLNRYLQTNLLLDDDDDTGAGGQGTTCTPLPWQQQASPPPHPMPEASAGGSSQSSPADSDIEDDEATDVASLSQAAQQAVAQRQAAAALTIQCHYRRYLAQLLLWRLQERQLAADRLVKRIISAAYHSLCGEQRSLAQRALRRQLRHVRRRKWRRMQAAFVLAEAAADTALPHADREEDAAASASQVQLAHRAAQYSADRGTLAESSGRAMACKPGTAAAAAAEAEAEVIAEIGLQDEAAAAAHAELGAASSCQTEAADGDSAASSAYSCATSAPEAAAAVAASGPQAADGPPTGPQPHPIALISARRVATPPPPAIADGKAQTVSRAPQCVDRRGSTPAGLQPPPLQEPPGMLASCSPQSSRRPSTSSSSGGSLSMPRSPALPLRTASSSQGQASPPRSAAAAGGRASSSAGGAHLPPPPFRQASSIQLLEAVQLGIDNGSGSVASQAARDVCERAVERAQELQRSASTGQPAAAACSISGGGRISRMGSSVQRQGSRAWPGVAAIQE